MAEGYSIANLDFFSIPDDHLHVVDLQLLRNSGISLTPTTDGLIFFVPSPRFLLSFFKRKLYQARNHFVTMLWPAPPSAVFAVIAAFVAIVVSMPESWLRTGFVAEYLWSIDECCNPVKDYLPPTLRIIYLSIYIALLFIIAAMALQRAFLRLLLSYRGWLFEDRPGSITKVWAMMLKLIYLPQQVLNGRRPFLYSFQNALPLLQVPSLDNTVARYLESMKPLMSADEFVATKKSAGVFVSGVGKKLQRFLIAKKYLWSGNYVSDWWLQYVYLKGRTPILINSNYYGCGWAWYSPSDNQMVRAAVLTYSILKFHILIDRERLDPMLIRGLVPLCMDQYRRMFAMCRIPGRDIDTLQKTNDSKHIVVLCKGTYFQLQVITDDGKMATPLDLLPQFQYIMSAAEKLAVKGVSDAKANISALTCGDRSKWADTRETYLKKGVNLASLTKIETALFVVALDDSKPGIGHTGWTKMARSLLHGDGGNRWVDKSFTLVVFADGTAGLHAEHSWADAPVIAHMWEHTFHEEAEGGVYSSPGVINPNLASAKPAQFPKPAPLDWYLTTGLEREVEAALKGARENIDDLDLFVMQFGEGPNEFGQKMMKQCKTSPDAFVQMALQLAYRKDSGKFCLTYESAMTRMYREGRTETIRSLSEESCAFVDSMLNPKESKKLRKEKLLLATAKHATRSKLAMSGDGVDRHLFALYVMGRGLKVSEDEIEFLKKALSVPWTLSSSQLPQRQTNPSFWKNPPSRERCSPSGGFGPVSEDGYGVSYMFATDDILYFHVSCKRSSGKSSSTRFADTIRESLIEIRSLFQD